MKMRDMNMIVALAILLLSILVLVAVVTGQHTTFGIVAAVISMVVALGMFCRVFIGTLVWRISDEENKEQLIDIAIFQKNDPEVVTEFARWIREDDRNFMGARVVDIMGALDKEGKRDGYVLKLIGTRKTYLRIKNKFKDTASVIDQWPLDRDEWSQWYLDNYLSDHDETEAPKEEDTTLEMKG